MLASSDPYERKEECLMARKGAGLVTGRNREAFRARVERARSGAAGAHDPRPNRRRTRGDRRRAAIADQRNGW